jgi:hypothetical protein
LEPSLLERFFSVYAWSKISAHGGRRVEDVLIFLPSADRGVLATIARDEESPELFLVLAYRDSEPVGRRSSFPPSPK